ncbi:hypothetical protein FZI91_18070 [Mycobacterium sp. CBMA271]|uniref:hypothetical protein n=1 Tax=unclassified Mycobacteroides TaxID=2618759 RepID=UPI0012DCDCB6|nr:MULTISPECIES: hypothetical protein [unclassified Mycobacteroides]MUM15501.1 hypothetical protein [Mycobacteroides sp. CBMA 326]MUM23590.1 hypothetical protein [Mycobacteroides sp. CBMA 271]
MKRWAATCVVTLLAVAGCSSWDKADSTPASYLPQKTGASPIRYDSGPLEQRFPKLPKPVTGEWVQGFFGDEPLPGPNTTYWVDAIIEMPPQQLAAYVAPFRSSMVLATRPRLWKTLDTGVSSTAQFERSDELDRMLSTNTAKGGWEVKAFAPKDGAVLVLSTQGKDPA